MQNELIARTAAYVKEKFENEYSGHDWFHTLRVFRTATRIAEAEGADVETVQLAALLHDVDDRKLSPETYADKANARSFLFANNVDESRIDEICRIIGEISFAENCVPSTLEGKCVQDADRLDAIGAVGIARAFAYGGNHNRLMYHPDIAPNPNMSREEYVKSNSTTVNHFHEKLFKLTDMMNTDTAKAIAKERDAYMKVFIAEFLDEWEGKK
ncbi:MAG: HD domain-containing protein [Clostridia bacterium]|nr:HD domain-containing protein [Clostridia bacterium]